eukprot:jgi/Botrbrau1/22850/Bobra.0065s0009.1
MVRLTAVVLFTGVWYGLLLSYFSPVYGTAYCYGTFHRCMVRLPSRSTKFIACKRPKERVEYCCIVYGTASLWMYQVHCL